ncbi:uncharacterized protein [Dysidea avara]|uniref:uncharacterized protein isoform X2 n=1 Tax=Dysidea avara TaxID=196820 RepID=UPI00332DC0F4
MAQLNCARSVTPVQDHENCCDESLSVGKRPRGTPIRQQKRIPLRHLANHETQQEAQELAQESPRNEISQQLQSNSVILQPRTLIGSVQGAANTTRDSKEKWTEKELKALAEFILFHSTPGEKWPANKHQEFWINASEFVKQRANTPGVRRSVNALRSKVTGWLAKRYKTPKDAETWCCGESVTIAQVSASPARTVQSEGVQTTPVDLAFVCHIFNQLQTECQLAALSELFSTYMSQFSLTVPADFLSNAANAMVRLSDAGRTNVLYNLAKGIEP